MSTENEVFVFLSPEVEELLADNQTSIAELLQREGVKVQQVFAKKPVMEEDSNQKDPATVILASAALAASLTPILTRLIERLSRRPILIREQVLIPIEDSSGNVLRNAKGEPILRLEDRSRYVEPADQKERLKSEVKGFGISISFDSSPRG